MLGVMKALTSTKAYNKYGVTNFRRMRSDRILSKDRALLLLPHVQWRFLPKDKLWSILAQYFHLELNAWPGSVRNRYRYERVKAARIYRTRFGEPGEFYSRARIPHFHTLRHRPKVSYEFCDGKVQIHADLLWYDKLRWWRRAR